MSDRTHSLLVEDADRSGCGYVPRPLAIDKSVSTPGRIELVGRCKEPVAYLITSSNHGMHSPVCVGHAAHARSCPECSQWIAAMESA